MLTPLEVIFCSSWYQRMRIGKFFKLIRIRFGKQVSELQKDEKVTFEISIRAKQLQKKILSKNACLRLRGQFFFVITTKRCANKSSLSLSGSNLENEYLKYGKLEKHLCI